MANSMLNQLQEELAYQFHNITLLKLALLHASFSKTKNNERLEFLGDAVMELCVSHFLYQQFPKEDEGYLTKMRAKIVCETSLASFAKCIGLGNYLVLGKCEEQGGREKNSILSDAVEAVLGAIYLDGGLSAANAFVQRVIQNSFQQKQENILDAKSELQILLQKDGSVDLHYVVSKEEGQPHNRVFFVDVICNGKALASGNGKSKKIAEQQAAKAALLHLKNFETGGQTC